MNVQYERYKPNRNLTRKLLIFLTIIVAIYIGYNEIRYNMWYVNLPVEDIKSINTLADNIMFIIARFSYDMGSFSSWMSKTEIDPEVMRILKKSRSIIDNYVLNDASSE